MVFDHREVWLRDGACLIKNNAVCRSKGFNDTGVFKLKFIFTENAEHIAICKCI